MGHLQELNDALEAELTDRDEYLPTSLTDQSKDDSAPQPLKDKSNGKHPDPNEASRPSSTSEPASPTKTEEEMDSQAYKKTCRGPNSRGPNRGRGRKDENDTYIDENTPASYSSAYPLTSTTNTAKKTLKSTSPCRLFKKGRCKWSEKCRFIHGEEPASAKSRRTPSARLRGEAPEFVPLPVIARAPQNGSRD